MRVEDQLEPPPSPRETRSFLELTTQLRELFAWAGRPKYVTLSHASGLAPSAISTLIGKRPLRRPSEASTLRFVEACLLHGGYSPSAATDQLEEWQSTWQRLDTNDGDTDLDTGSHAGEADAGPPEESGAPDGRRRRRGPVTVGVLAVLAVLAVLVVVGLVVGVLVRTGAFAGHRSPGQGTTAGATPEAQARCERTSIPPAHDVRHQRTWTSVFRCPDEKGAQVLLEPEPGSPVVSRLTYDTSWFVCWTRGKQHVGGSSIWYYTQGDTPGSHPKVHSWGYVASNQLGTERDPDPRAFRHCPAE